MRRKKKTALVITSRDLEILKNLWKWKVGTTASIGYEFFGNADSDAAYQRLIRLMRFEYVQLLSLPKTGEFVWSLAPKGYAHIKEFLPSLKEDGFLSETLNHDYWCMALHRGPMTLDSMKIECVSEQELRRLHPSCFPEWVPVSEVHRPDGYWRVQVNGKIATVALEVELTRKKDHLYHLVGRFYQHLPNIFRVVWLVPTDSDARLIQEKFRATVPDSFQKHLFITIPEFTSRLWQSTILLGREESKSLGILLERCPSSNPPQGETRVILDKSKRPWRIKSYRLNQNREFRDRVAISATPYNPLTQRTNHEANSPTYPTVSSSLSMFHNQTELKA